MRACLIFLAFASVMSAEDETRFPKLFDREPPKVAPTDSELQKLLKERYEVVWKELKEQQARMVGGVDDVSRSGGSILEASERFIESYLALDTGRNERIENVTDYVAFVRNIESIYKKRYDAGALRIADLHRATWYRLDAEIKLLKAKEAK